MHIYKLALTILLTTALASSSLFAFASAESDNIVSTIKPKDQIQNCLALINSSINKTEDIKLLMNPTLASIDAVVINGSLVMAAPTAFAALPAGAALLAARGLGASTYKEVKKSSQERARQIFLDAIVYKQFRVINEEGLTAYPALEELVTRVNGPINTLLRRGYSADTVAELVIKATEDSKFCENSNNFRMVHFKDYVLTNVVDAKKKRNEL